MQFAQEAIVLQGIVLYISINSNIAISQVIIVQFFQWPLYYTIKIITEQVMGIMRYCYSGLTRIKLKLHADIK